MSLWGRYKGPFIAWMVAGGGVAAYDIQRAATHHDTLSRAAGDLMDEHWYVKAAVYGGLGYLGYHLTKSKTKDES